MDNFIDWLIKNRWWVLLVMIIGVWSGGLGLYQYYFQKTADREENYYSKRQNDVEENQNFDSSLVRPEVTNNKPSDTSKYIDSTKNRFLLTIDSLNRLIDTKDSLKNNRSTFEVSEFNNFHSREINSSDGTTIQMNEPPPKEGFGKLAIRSYCDYSASHDVRIIVSSDSLHYKKLDFFPAMYDTKNKSRTTYIRELLPGKYQVELYYQYQGSAEFEVEVFANKMSLYRYIKTNPFGKGNAQIVFTTNNDQLNKWKITLDKVYLGIITIKPYQGIYLKVKGNISHFYKIEALKPNGESTTLDVDSDSFPIVTGQRLYKLIN